jgi:predicted cupin superfamily sugar epimerase
MMIDELLAAYDWFEHPDGPYFFVETHRDSYRTSGHWLFLPGGFSSFHKVCNNEELWLIHAGRLLLHLLDPDGAHHVLRLGPDLAAGERRHSPMRNSSSRSVRSCCERIPLTRS